MLSCAVAQNAAIYSSYLEHVTNEDKKLIAMMYQKLICGVGFTVNIDIHYWKGLQRLQSNMCS